MKIINEIGWRAIFVFVIVLVVEGGEFVQSKHDNSNVVYVFVCHRARERER